MGWGDIIKVEVGGEKNSGGRHNRDTHGDRYYNNDGDRHYNHGRSTRDGYNSDIYEDRSYYKKQDGYNYNTEPDFTGIEMNNLQMKKQILENEINELTIDLQVALKNGDKIIIEGYNNLIKEKRLELNKIEERLNQYGGNNMPNYSQGPNNPQKVIIEHRESLPDSASLSFLPGLINNQGERKGSYSINGGNLKNLGKGESVKISLNIKESHKKEDWRDKIPSDSIDLILLYNQQRGCIEVINSDSGNLIKTFHFKGGGESNRIYIEKNLYIRVNFSY